MRTPSPRTQAWPPGPHRPNAPMMSVGWLLSLGLLALPGLARAQFFDVFGAGARSQGMAGAVGALTADPMAVFHNPAGLADGPPVLQLGFGGAFNRSSILLNARPAGYDPPDYTELQARGDTVEPPGTAGILLGYSMRVFSEDLTFGALLFVPFEGFASMNGHFGDETEQYFTNRLHFELMGDRLDSEAIAFGLGYRLRPWLSMGIGMSVLMGANVTAPVYVPNATELTEVDIEARVRTQTARALSGGVIARPVENLRVAVAFQDEISLRINGISELQIRGDEEEGLVNQRLDLVTSFTPIRVTGSVAWVDEEHFTVTLESTWRAWSRYVDNHNQPAGFEDTFDAKAAVEWPVAERTFARAGFVYTPSPVPDQTGRTNYVDNDRLGFAFGAGSELRLWDLDLSVDVALQVQSLLTRSVKKQALARHPDCADGVSALCDEVPDQAEDTPLLRAAETQGLQTGNPGFPGFVHGGYLVAASVDFKWKF